MISSKFDDKFKVRWWTQNSILIPFESQWRIFRNRVYHFEFLVSVAKQIVFYVTVNLLIIINLFAKICDGSLKVFWINFVIAIDTKLKT